MSNNIYNIIYKVPTDPNTYHLKDIPIEFIKDYQKEHNPILPNMSYNFQTLDHTNNTYPKVEFQRKDPVGYIKLKNSSKWFYEDKSDFDFIRCGNFASLQPIVVWFEYVRENEVIAYKLVSNDIKRKNRDYQSKEQSFSNVKYLHYEYKNNQVKLSWVNNINLATKFIYEKVKWSDEGWIKLLTKEERKLLGI